MKNTGKKSEEIFEDHWGRIGKTAYAFRFTDAAEATGTNKRRTTIKAQPSDYIVTYLGKTFYAEVKSTVHERLFPFSMLRKTQSAYAKFVLAAGGDYLVYVHSLHHDKWFCVPYIFINYIKGLGRASATWEELEKFSCMM